MIMPAGQRLLLPVNPRFIALSLLLALLLNMLLGLTGQSWLPDVLALVLVFWTIHQPRRVGMLTAFALGLAVDVHESALLGQNALAYICLSHLANLIHRRVLWFPLREQTVQVLPLFVVAAVIEWLTRLITQDTWPTGRNSSLHSCRPRYGPSSAICCWPHSAARSTATTFALSEPWHCTCRRSPSCATPGLNSNASRPACSSCRP